MVATTLCGLEQLEGERFCFYANANLAGGYIRSR